MANTPNLQKAAGNKIVTALSGSITDSTLSITVVSVAGMNIGGGYIIIDESNSSKREIVYYESIAGSTLTVAADGRGKGGTSAVAHDAGAIVTDVITAEMFNDTQDMLEVEHNDDGTHTTTFVNTIKTAIYNTLYPVGSLYFNATSGTNPGTLLGFGTWVAFGAGKMLVGLNSGDADFNTVEETGGSKTKTIAQANLPNYSLSVNDPGHKHNTYYEVTAAAGSARGSITASTNGGATAIPDGTNTVTTGITVSSGGSGTALNVMNPYIVVYMWKRTA